MRRRLIQTILVAILALVPLIASAQSTVTTSGFQVQNLSTSSPANIVIEYYNQQGTIVATQNAEIPKNGSLTFFDGNGGTVAMAVPSPFRGSVVISSDQAIVAITNLIGINGNVSIGEAYSGFNSGSQAVSLPLVARGNFGYNSTIIVQNTGASTTNVTINYIPGGAGTAGSQTASIPVGASATFQQADFGTLGTRFVGSATVTAATGGEIAAVVVMEGNNQLSSYSGFNANLTPSAVAVPLIVSNNFGGLTGLQIKNNGTATKVTVTYSPNTVTTAAGAFQPCPTPAARTFDLAAGASVTTIHANGAAANGFDSQFANCRYVGGASITSDNNQPLTAIVNQAAGPNSSAYEGFQIASATSSARAPLVLANNFGNTTGIQVQNVGSAETTVTIAYGPNTITTNEGGTPCPTPTARTITLPAGSSATRIQAGGLAANGFDDQFATCRYVGAATITGGAGSQIVAIVNQASALTDGLFTYNAFGQ